MPDGPPDPLATKADLYRALLIQGAAVVVATVALLKLLPWGNG